MRYYTGIGSRNTPPDILELMTKIATYLEQQGYTLRSGGANGADSAFEAGVHNPNNADIYLPWKGFNNSSSPLWHIAPRAFEIAETFHPAWDRCSHGARKLHARNVHQVLGFDLVTPTRSDFVICWTPNGELVGGTSQAIRIAHYFGIPVFNLGDQNAQQLFSKEN